MFPGRYSLLRAAKLKTVVLPTVAAGEIKLFNHSSASLSTPKQCSRTSNFACEAGISETSHSTLQKTAPCANLSDAKLLPNRTSPLPLGSIERMQANKTSSSPCRHGNYLTPLSGIEAKSDSFKVPSAMYHHSSVVSQIKHSQNAERECPLLRNSRISSFHPHHSLWTSVNGSAHHPLLRQRDKYQISHHSMSSFSVTRSILEASPQHVQPYLRLIRFDKPIGTWLLYWPCTWSIALAAEPGGMPDLKLLALFGAGAFLMRGAGCIINDMWDKDIDAKVERTKTRPIASGEITQFQALVFLGTQLSCAMAILFQLNNYSIVLGIASLGLVITYPLAKRFTYWPQFMLGLTLNWGVLLAWSALRGTLELPALVLYAACTLYTVTYDSLYAHQDKYDDMLIGVKSTAIKLGDQTKPWLSAFTGIMAGGLFTTGYLCDMTWPYYLGVSLTCARLLQQIYSVDLNDADSCAHAFRGNFYLGIIMFTGIVLANYIKSKEQGEEVREEKMLEERFKEELSTDKKDKVIMV